MFKVSRLQYWVARPWTKGFLIAGLDSIKNIVEKFLLKKNPPPEQTNDDVNDDESGPQTQNSSASVSKPFLTLLYRQDPESGPSLAE